MKVIGITGGVGAGKSTVLNYLKENWKAEIILTDEAGHQVMEPGEDCYCEILCQFGDEILSHDGKINRKHLGEIVFRDSQKLEILNSLVHPAVKHLVLHKLQEAEKNGVKLFVIESALLFSDNYDAICDEVWYIYADEAVRVERIVRERGYSGERIKGILANQSSDEFFRSRCPVIIENNGDWQQTCLQINEAVDAVSSRKEDCHSGGLKTSI